MSTETARFRPDRRGIDAEAAPTTPGSWAIDAEASSLQISVKVGFLATVTGRFSDVRGHIDMADALVDSSIAVEVATGSLTSGSAHWDGVLLAAGLVDTTTNPTISFESTGITARGVHWLLGGLLVTERGCLPVEFQLECLGQRTDRIRFRATGAISSRDAVRLLSQPGVERLIGRTMTVDLVVEAVRLR